MTVPTPVRTWVELLDVETCAREAIALVTGAGSPGALWVHASERDGLAWAVIPPGELCPSGWLRVTRVEPHSSALLLALDVLARVERRYDPEPRGWTGSPDWKLARAIRERKEAKQ